MWYVRRHHHHQFVSWLSNSALVFQKCGAIAAAVLGDSNAYRIEWDGYPERFPALQRKEFDILFRADHTASRDIFEVRLEELLLYDSKLVLTISMKKFS